MKPQDFGPVLLVPTSYGGSAFRFSSETSDNVYEFKLRQTQLDGTITAVCIACKAMKKMDGQRPPPAAVWIRDGRFVKHNPEGPAHYCQANTIAQVVVKRRRIEFTQDLRENPVPNSKKAHDTWTVDFWKDPQFSTDKQRKEAVKIAKKKTWREGRRNIVRANNFKENQLKKSLNAKSMDTMAGMVSTLSD